MTKRIYLNQDDSAFTRCHPIEDMTREGAERLVDYYAEAEQLAGLAFCVNMQRALFQSKAWETLIDGYDPALGNDQPILKRSGEAAGTVALLRNGVDQFTVWLNRARHHGIEAALSMRMNDCHGLEGHGDFWSSGLRKKGRDQAHFQWHATEFWKANPQLRRAPYRYERSFEGAFDYTHEIVRKHHLALIAELFERYDMDGFEMDWMRWMYLFAPGKEAKGREILCEFIEQVNQLKKVAEQRLGHPIFLRHRVPAEPQTAYALGYDVATWAERGLADQVILSGFGAVTNHDYPIPFWRRLLGSSVKIIALVEAAASPYPGVKVDNLHFSLGAASSALKRGADGVYLFNDCYMEAKGPERKRVLSDMLNTLGSLTTLNQVVRRHPVTYPQIHAPGEALRCLLPIPLRNDAIGTRSGRWAENITLRINIGDTPSTARYYLCLGFSSESPCAELQQMTVRINTTPISPSDAPVYTDCMAEVRRVEIAEGHIVPNVPPVAAHLLYYLIDPSAILPDTNVVEFEPPQTEGRLEWAEIIVCPDSPLE